MSTGYYMYMELQLCTKETNLSVLAEKNCMVVQDKYISLVGRQLFFVHWAKP